MSGPDGRVGIYYHPGATYVQLTDAEDGEVIFVLTEQLPFIIDRLRQIQQEIELCTIDTLNGDPATDQNSNRRHDS